MTVIPFPDRGYRDERNAVEALAMSACRHVIKVLEGYALTDEDRLLTTAAIMATMLASLLRGECASELVDVANGVFKDRQMPWLLQLQFV